MGTDGTTGWRLQEDDVLPACRPTVELLAAWVDGGLHGDEARLVTRHVAQCARCTEEAQALREVLGDLHAAMEDSPVADRDPQFWAAMAANIDAAIDHTPQETTATEASNVVALPVRPLRSLAWVVGGALAAAALAVVAMQFSADAPLSPALKSAAPHWTDALQARMSIEDDPASGDSDPIDDLEDLDDDEVEALATQLGEEG